MADTKISALTAKDIPVAADVAVIVDSNGGANKKILIGNIPLTGNIELKALATGILKNNTGTGTPSIAVAGDIPGNHAAVTLDANAGAILSLSTQEVGLDVQNVNKVLAGPTSGGDAVPTFRALVAADIPGVLPFSYAGLANLGYVGFTITGVAGETLAPGDPVYLKAADSRWWKTDASAAATMSNHPALAVSTAASGGDAVTLLILGYFRKDALSFSTNGAPIYISETAGELVLVAPSDAGDQVQVAGEVTDVDNIIKWDPDKSIVEVGTGAVTLITVDNEATDTTCFLVFVTAATGDLGPKTNANLAFNANTGVLTFGAFPITPSSAPTTDYQVANKKYVDDNSGSGIGYALMFSTQGFAPADETTYYFGSRDDSAPAAAATYFRIVIPKTGAIKAVALFQLVAGVLGTNEATSLLLRLNNTSDTTIVNGTFVQNAEQAIYTNTALNIAVSAGDYVEFKWLTPAWATNPTNVIFKGSIYIE